MSITSIEWTDRTWNPTRGCSRVSPGCVNCYAERMAARVSAYGVKPDSPFAGFVTKVNGHAAWTGKVELIESKLMEPLSWRKPARVFVNSMSDLFHEALPDEAIDRVFAVMALCPQHTFQVLTKRPERMRKWMQSRGPGGDKHSIGYWAHQMHPKRFAPTGEMAIEWPLPNVWLGVSVEDRKNKDRIDMLRDTPAAVRFLSVEPLLEDIGELDLRGISWVIVGGESGPGARPFELAWARCVRDQCKAAGVAFFFKQAGAVCMDGVIKTGVPGYGGLADGVIPTQRILGDKKGGDMAEWPEDLRVRQFPIKASA